MRTIFPLSIVYGVFSHASSSKCDESDVNVLLQAQSVLRKHSSTDELVWGSPDGPAVEPAVEPAEDTAVEPAGGWGVPLTQPEIDAIFGGPEMDCRGVYEAEIADSHPGSHEYTGYFGVDGLVSMHSRSRAAIHWTVPNCRKKFHTLRFRYSQRENKNFQLTVNDVSQSVHFPETGGFSVWSEANFVVDLEEGPNSIGLAAEGDADTMMDNVMVDDAPDCRGLYEAENADRHPGSHQYTGYFGVEGLVSMHSRSRAGIVWSLPNCGQRTATLRFRYSQKEDKNFQLIVNADDQFDVCGLPSNAACGADGWTDGQAVSFPATGGWREWSEAVFVIELEEGVNIIQLMAHGDADTMMDNLMVE